MSVKKASINEFNSINLLDEWKVDEIKKEYFLGTFVFSVIAIAISAVFAVVTYLLAGNKASVISTLLIVGSVLCWVSMPCWIFRCIISLIIYFKINNHNFVWRIGNIDGRERIGERAGYRRYGIHLYVVDDEYYSSLHLSPLYKKGTAVYLLYFPHAPFLEFLRCNSVVVKIKA